MSLWRKKKPAPVMWFDAEAFERISKALKIMNRARQSTGVAIYGNATADDKILGRAFYHAPAESYVIEWNQ